MSTFSFQIFEKVFGENIPGENMVFFLTHFPLKIKLGAL